LAEGHEWLTRRIEAYVHEHGAGAGVDGADAWAASVAEISDAMFEAGYRTYASPDHGEDITLRHDPVAAFGVLRARAHFDRRASLSAWLELMRHHRRGYAELVDSAEFGDRDLREVHRFVNRFFDRYESGFSAEWSRLARSGTLRSD
jgi:hypothetical protein